MQDEKVKSGVRKKRTADSTNKKAAAFFGKLPNMDNGLTFQKKVRSEWK